MIVCIAVLVEYKTSSMCEMLVLDQAGARVGCLASLLPACHLNQSEPVPSPLSSQSNNILLHQTSISDEHSGFNMTSMIYLHHLLRQFE